MTEKNVNILVEGPTEERFVKDVLAPYFNPHNIRFRVVIITTKHIANGPDKKGGYVPYTIMKNDLKKLLGDTSATIVTTMFDFYAFPEDLKDSPSLKGTCYEKVKILEDRLLTDIPHRRFLPYLQLHEFEALLFSEINEIVRQFELEGSRDFKELKSKFEDIIGRFKTPEEINDNPKTCPSKRIISTIENYRKLLHGPTIAQNIGIEAIRTKCPHFNDWIAKLESLS